MEITNRQDRTDPCRTFLIIHIGGLGDWILAWPSINRLRRAYPEHRFVGIGRQDYMKLAARF
jgi:ADP-heptose:LPS heptosyltransferase